MASIEEGLFKNDRLDVQNLPKFEEVELASLSPKYLLKLNISTTIFLLIVSTVVTAAYFIFSAYRIYLPYVALFLLLLFAWNYYSNFQLQKLNGYAVRERDIIYRKGFLFEKYTVVPFNRVQHVSTNRGVLDKTLNISTLKVFTAGGSGSDVSIPGLIPETANSLKEALSDRMAGHV